MGKCVWNCGLDKKFLYKSTWCAFIRERDGDKVWARRESERNAGLYNLICFAKIIRHLYGSELSNTVFGRLELEAGVGMT